MQSWRRVGIREISTYLGGSTPSSFDITRLDLFAALSLQDVRTMRHSLPPVRLSIYIPTTPPSLKERAMVPAKAPLYLFAQFLQHKRAKSRIRMRSMMNQRPSTARLMLEGDSRATTLR